MLEKFAAQSLIEDNGELIFSKEKFTELIVKECMSAVGDDPMAQPYIQRIKAKFGVAYYEPIEKAFGVEE